MKKKLLAVVLCTLTVVSLTGCGKYTCDFCGSEKFGFGNKHEILGQEIILCGDCEDSWESIKDGFNSIGNLFK